MTTNLTPELQKQIEQEGGIEAKKLTCRVPMFKFGYESGYGDAGEKYALKWQGAEQLIDEVTEKITDLMDFVAEAKGQISDEEIISQVRKSLPVLLEALTPKTTTDDTANG